MDEGDAGEMATEGLDETRVSVEATEGLDAQSLLGTVRWILAQSPRYIDLTCSHDTILKYTDHGSLPTRIGDMRWCTRCKSRQMVVGISLTETDSPAFSLLRELIGVLSPPSPNGQASVQEMDDPYASEE